jgi:thioredoxin 1
MAYPKNCVTTLHSATFGNYERQPRKLSKNRRITTMFEDNELEQIKQKKIQAMLNQADQQKLVSSHPLTVTDGNFAETVKTNPLIVVDFWAPWCGPCRMVGPVIEQLAAEYAGKVAFGKMNVDENQTVPSSFSVMSIPTIVVFHNGAAVERIVGAYPKAQIEATFKRYIEG